MKSNHIGVPSQDDVSLLELSPTRASVSSGRRLRIPDKPKNVGFSLWTLLKNCVGKDLTQIPFPVHVNEPLSMLQRLTEDFEYFELLDRAAICSCPDEQLAYLGVFIISGYASSTRTTKPFSPLLGETYELDRSSDLGWRIVCEQVSHHPPKMAQHCEGRNWVFWQELSIETKFTGNDIHVFPKGQANVEFKAGSSYSWNKVGGVIHNFIIGTLWVDQVGEINIIGKNRAEGITCKINFIAYPSGLRRVDKSDYRRVIGEVVDASGNKKWFIQGNWDDKISITPVINKAVKPEQHLLGEPLRIWNCNLPVEGSENYYNFSVFACQLNEPEDHVAPTDSRLRPDQRLMEDGSIEEANQEKTRLEEKQRAVIKKRAMSALDADNCSEPYEPVWFKPKRDENGQLFHEFRGHYWKCKENHDWSMCPDLFS